MTFTNPLHYLLCYHIQSKGYDQCGAWITWSDEPRIIPSVLAVGDFVSSGAMCTWSGCGCLVVAGTHLVWCVHEGMAGQGWSTTVFLYLDTDETIKEAVATLHRPCIVSYWVDRSWATLHAIINLFWFNIKKLLNVSVIFGPGNGSLTLTFVWVSRPGWCVCTEPNPERAGRVQEGRGGISSWFSARPCRSWKHFLN